MIAAMTTLLFLTIIWLVGLLAVRVAVDSWPRVVAAIEGLEPARQPRRRAAA
jgi:hypothetical protein